MIPQTDETRVEPINGPAFVDMNNGVAHKVEDCPRFAGVALVMGIACAGPMTGFEWCAICADKPFTGCGDECECINA